MSEFIGHKCGIALIRLLKPLEYYVEKYGSYSWALSKLYLLMEKQHNRGQDGAGLVSIKFETLPGKEYVFRVRSNAREPIRDVFSQIDLHIQEKLRNNPHPDTEWVKENLPFIGEVMLGHLRYGTFGANDISSVHPVLRRSNWKSKTLTLAGNFNLTNVDEIFKQLQEKGQHPREYSDTITILENIGYYLDEQNQALQKKFLDQGYTPQQAAAMIEQDLDLVDILKKASIHWDGGYALAGIIGHGDAFVIRDPWGIRPAFYYKDNEVVVVTSERPVIQTIFGVPSDNIHELQPGHALIIKRNGSTQQVMINKPKKKKSCSFERIYFSRGSDADIYQERKMLGRLLVPQVLEAIDYDIENTVFSYIPNTAESAFYGLVEGVREYLRQQKINRILDLQEKGKLTRQVLEEIMSLQPRVEKTAIKDIKLRTFITQEADRAGLVRHVYDVTYGTVRPGIDNLVVIDDSIVRGTTLKQSILRILDMLKPRRIVVVSSAPQIRYPDCYGIDMADLENLIAFQAAIQLLNETGQHYIIRQVYFKCKEQQNLPKEKVVNFVKEIYQPFTDGQIADKIAQLLKTDDIKAEVKIVYQTIENLHKAIPDHTGDWYFTGDFPTPGGNKVVNTAFINYIEGKKGRAY